MLVVTPFCPADQEQALAQARWLQELGGAKGHQLILIADTACHDGIVNNIRDLFARSFDSVELLPFVDHWRKWPDSPNQCFSAAAGHVLAKYNQPWAFLEPDTVLLKHGALDEWWAEYEAARKLGKWFLGDLVTAGNSGVPVTTHMSGNAIWPANLYDHCGNVFLAGDLAFDISGAEQIVPQMQKSELLLHKWRSPAFGSWEEVQLRIFDIKPKAVIFHSDKSGSLYPLLREQRNGIPTKAGAPDVASGGVLEANPIGVSTKSVKIGTQTATQPALSMTCDIFVKSWPQDYPWLEYCVKSIGRFATQFSQLVLLYPVGHEPHDKRLVFALDPTGGCGGEGVVVEYVPVEEYKTTGYLSQMIFKLYADEFTEAEYICYVDSDTIFTRPVSPDMFFTDGKLNWLMSPHSTVDTPWQDGATKFLGQFVEFEFMRRFCITVPRWLLEETRRFCRELHGMSMSEYVMAQEPPNPPFSEFNALGAYAYAFHRDRFNWIDTSQVPESEWPTLVVLQKFSHDGISEATKAEFETILSGGVEIPQTRRHDRESQKDGCLTLSNREIGDSPAQAFSTAVISATTAEDIRALISEWPPQTPWADRAKSIAEINRLAARLKEFQTSSIKVRFVRELMHKQGVIKLSYRNKRRKGWKRKKK